LNADAKKGQDVQHLRTVRILAAFLALISLAACGFKPVYGTGSPIGEILSDIEVVAPVNHEEYLLVRSLEERLGRHSNARATLRYNLGLSEQGLGLSTTSRTQVHGTVGYQLVSNEDGTVMVSGSVTNFTSYASQRALYPARRADAVERLMSILADQVITDLSLRLNMT
jgi:LPS-assembly lipoprotein